MYHALRTWALIALIGGSVATLLAFYVWWRSTEMSERVGRSVALAEEGYEKLDAGDVEQARELFKQALEINKRLEMAKEGLRACRRAEQ